MLSCFEFDRIAIDKSHLKTMVLLELFPALNEEPIDRHLDIIILITEHSFR